MIPVLGRRKGNRYLPLPAILAGTVVLLIAAACGGDDLAIEEQTPAETPSAAAPSETASSDVPTGPSSSNVDAEAAISASPAAAIPATLPLIQNRQVGLLADPGPDCGDPLKAPKGAAEGKLAAEITGIHAWLNSKPLCLSDLRGKVVLVDFWTYTCVNCIRTFPYLKLWQSRYVDDGLVILGVHSPEFEFEKEPNNVRQAAADNGIVWPVALDNDMRTWRAFSNRFWPAKYLIDKDGVIRYTHFGEGSYAETEEKIRELLVEIGANLSLLDFELPQDQEVDPSFLEDGGVVTPELYGGFARGCHPFYGPLFVADPQYCQSTDEIRNYRDSGDHEGHLIHLKGPWYAGEENLRYSPDTLNGDYSDYMLIKFTAKSVNAVVTPDEGEEPFKVLVTLDDQYMTEENKGADVVIESDGRSFLIVDEPRLYMVVEAQSYGTYELKLSSNSPQFALFAFTFGVYASGA